MLAKLSLCRTHVLGGRKYQCRDCDEITTRYNSCGDRHCPRCSGGKRADFNEKASKLLLPGVAYYQVVFTLPSELSELALANRYEMADLLNDSAWKSLSKSIRDEQAYQPAGISVLHTWNQRLDSHWHVHLLVPGEGPSLAGGDWRQAAAPPEARNSDGYYLVDADRLRKTYRGRAIRRLKRLRSTGKLRLGGKFEYLQADENWDALIRQLESTEWVAYIQPPPAPTSQGNEVVNYLTRYLTGGPIGNHRITRADEREVTFLAREGKQVGGERQQVPIRLGLHEFVRRWCLHIQPDQLTKTRYLGGWSNTCRAAYMSRCQKLRLLTGAPTETPPQPSPEEIAAPARLACAGCDGDRLVLIEETAKPSWREIFQHGSDACPAWYARLRAASDRVFWDAAMGAGFNDWYLETVIKGAKAAWSSPLPPPRQLHLPGIGPGADYQVESF